ncbi:RagB/SusD family nutrient uptake outer membrane protein [Sphingobacterium bovistauri]|uniref:RagB/SusD family nutrient uptake outer membrane protein n=1 Tax=Sphingobacterium bovistauri TaxID=2781959 RepID=A0ABS7Z6Q1_9SPHI|nr:RagB/SusD family nutrient uptake outer membrane protein [Sphingobacterium bovistauri]MCA5005096.1 RagB/SusD family nutrient uptake outer membrane protein [Sphingobacterium bovistauri]
MKTILKLKTYIFFTCLVHLTTSCEKFFDTTFQNSTSVTPKYVEDYEEMLNSTTFASPNYFVADLVSDDIYISDAMYNNTRKEFILNAYEWKKNIWSDLPDYMYNTSYKQILQLNFILQNIDVAISQSIPDKKEIVKSEALIQRAYIYLQLVNIYGAAYNSTTSKTDLSIPLVLEPNVLLPKQETVETIYKQIITDINNVINTNSLENFGKDILHPGKAAAYALLARTYLYMNDFENALVYADKALVIKNSLYNYNDLFLPLFNYPKTLVEFNSKNDEVIFQKIGNDKDFVLSDNKLPYISKDLENTFEKNDLRLLVKYSESDNIQPSIRPFSTKDLYFDYGINVPEMMLIKAECLTRANNHQDAVELLNELRINRFSPENFISIKYHSNSVLDLVLKERRRELAFHGGVRLFDIKRLAALENNHTTISRTTDDGTPRVSISSSNNKLLIPFSDNLLLGNPNIKQHE